MSNSRNEKAAWERAPGRTPAGRSAKERKTAGRRRIGFGLGVMVSLYTSGTGLAMAIGGPKNSWKKMKKGLDCPGKNQYLCILRNLNTRRCFMKGFTGCKTSSAFS